MNIKFFIKTIAVVFVMITITFSENVRAGFQIKEKTEIQLDDPPLLEEVRHLYYDMIFKGEISMLSVVDSTRFYLTLNGTNAPVPESVKNDGKCLGTVGQIGNEKDREQFEKDHKKLLEENPDKIVVCYFEIKSDYLEAWYITTDDEVSLFIKTTDAGH
jgi:hypothetical protein